VLQRVDEWLATELGAQRRQAIVEALVEQTSRPFDAGVDAARKKIAECDRKLKQYRADAEKESRRGSGRVPISQQEIADSLDAIGGLVEVIAGAESGEKADLYRELGLRLTYRPQKQLVEARLIPGLHMCKRYVSEGGHDIYAHGPAR
jgi:hypothetical protein